MREGVGSLDRWRIAVRNSIVTRLRDLLGNLLCYNSGVQQSWFSIT